MAICKLLMRYVAFSDIVCEYTELGPGGSLVRGVLCKRWPMSWPCISVCLALVCSIAFAALMALGVLGLTLSSGVLG